MSHRPADVRPEVHQERYHHKCKEDKNARERKEHPFYNRPSQSNRPVLCFLDQKLYCFRPRILSEWKPLQLVTEDQRIE